MGYVENIGHYLSGLVHHATWVENLKQSEIGSPAGLFSIGPGGSHGLHS